MAIFVILAAAVIAAILFAPRKPPPPPASAITYEGKPAQHIVDSDEPDHFVRHERRRRKDVPPPPKDESSGRYKIVGRVTDAKTGKPIENARINCDSVVISEQLAELKKVVPWNAEAEKKQQELSELRRKSSGRAETDEEGNYVIRVDSRGEYVFHVWAKAHIAVEGQRKTLEEGADELQMDFALSTGASISGRITESGTSNGAKGVTILAEGPPPYRNEAQSDEKGNYTVAGLGPGEFTVTLQMRKCPYVVTGMIPTKNVSIKTETQDVRGIDFVVDAAGQVWGYVTTREGEPVKGIDMVLCTSASVFSQVAEASLKQAPPLTGNSDENGYYELIGVPLNKEWKLYAMSKERAPQLTAPFILTPSQRTARIDVFITPGSTVYGHVVDTDRKPIADAEVICIPAYSKFFSPLDAPQAFRNQRSKEDGSFEIPQLPLGEYQVMAQKRGYKFAAMGEPIYPDGFTEIRNVEVVLTSVESGQFTVYGTVTDAEGKPISDVRLSLGSLSGEDLSAGESETTSDSQGNYTFQGVQSGFTLLRAEKPGFQGQNVSNVKLDEPTNIVMQAGATIKGRVLVRETSKPPENAQVMAVRIAGSSGGKTGLGFLDEGGFKSTSVDGAGNFTMEVASGSYMLEARSSGLTSGRTQVTVEAGQSRDDVTIYVRKSGGRIQGRVTVSDGKSAAGALAWLSQGDSDIMGALPDFGPMSQQKGIQVGADGAFEFANLSAGTYTVRAKLEGYAQASSSPIDLGDAQNVSGIEVQLRAGGALEGYVAFSGKIESGAIVTVVGNGVSEMATSDANGYYRINQLPAGSYLASAVSFRGGPAAGLFSPLHGRVDITDGATTQYNFGETTQTRLSGLCTPPPQAGTFGYAVLHMTDGPTDVSSLNFSNPASWFQDSSDMASYIVGMSTVSSDGSFEMDNLLEGEFLLDVFYANFAEIMGGNVRRVYSGPVKIIAGQPTEVEIPIGGG